MARYLFIVSLQHEAVYGVLLSNDSKVDVILDRRRVNRRRASVPVALERRNADRRQHVGINDELRRQSVAVVTVS
jgi:hypothetical protein